MANEEDRCERNSWEQVAERHERCLGDGAAVHTLRGHVLGEDAKREDPQFELELRSTLA